MMWYNRFIINLVNDGVSMHRPVIYLGGSIRNGVPEDSEWREKAWAALEGLYTILDPLNGKTYHGEEVGRDKKNFKGALDNWSFGNGFWEPLPRQTVKQDRRDVSRCDMGVWNLRALRDGYPCTGSTVEIGWADAWDKLIYIIHPEPQEVHPFYCEVAARIFISVEEALEFLGDYGLRSGGEKVKIWNRFSSEGSKKGMRVQVNHPAHSRVYQAGHIEGGHVC
jgi:hypothetical protein